MFYEWPLQGCPELCGPPHPLEGPVHLASGYRPYHMPLPVIRLLAVRAFSLRVLAFAVFWPLLASRPYRSPVENRLISRYLQPAPVLELLFQSVKDIYIVHVFCVQ